MKNTPLTVHLEPVELIDRSDPLERCVDCKEPTRYWMDDKHTPLCQDCCAKRNAAMSIGPTATFWALRKRGKNVPLDVSSWTVFPDHAVEAYWEMAHTHELVKITVEPQVRVEKADLQKKYAHLKIPEQFKAGWDARKKAELKRKYSS